MNNLSYVNIFSKNIIELSGFYKNLFGFKNIPEIESPIFRGLNTGKSCIGFNAFDAYELLEISDKSDVKGCKFLLNIDVDSKEDVDKYVSKAIESGATLIKSPYLSYYNWYQAVLLDPEENVFRINFVCE
jgi:predicted lactoylglutathione lyase|tara:strand:- start:5371 stop:5760 length:390 start_codon:yes stop_codon:yes gene_type:complete